MWIAHLEFCRSLPLAGGSSLGDAPFGQWLQLTNSNILDQFGFVLLHQMAKRIVPRYALVCESKGHFYVFKSTDWIQLGKLPVPSAHHPLQTPSKRALISTDTPVKRQKPQPTVHTPTIPSSETHREPGTCYSRLQGRLRLLSKKS